VTSQTAYSLVSSNNNHHTPVLNTRIWSGASNQSVSPGITRPLHATVNKTNLEKVLLSFCWIWGKNHSL